MDKCPICKEEVEDPALHMLESKECLDKVLAGLKVFGEWAGAILDLVIKWMKEYEDDIEHIIEALRKSR